MQQRRIRAMFVDGEVIDDWLDGKRHGVFQAPLEVAHHRLQAFLRFRFSLRVENKAHAAAGHAADHPEAVKIVVEFRFDLRNQRFGKQITRPGDNRLNRAVEIALRDAADGRDIPLTQMFENLIEKGDRLQTPLPFGVGAEQIFFRHHFQNRPDILRHAAMHEDKAVLQALARRFQHFVVGDDAMARQQTAATDAEFRVALFGADAFDQFHARPDAAGILPAAARPGQPFAQNGASRHESPLLFA